MTEFSAEQVERSLHADAAQVAMLRKWVVRCSTCFLVCASAAEWLEHRKVCPQRHKIASKKP